SANATRACPNRAASASATESLPAPARPIRATFLIAKPPEPRSCSAPQRLLPHRPDRCTAQPPYAPLSKADRCRYAGHGTPRPHRDGAGRLPRKPVGSLRGLPPVVTYVLVKLPPVRAKLRKLPRLRSRPLRRLPERPHHAPRLRVHTHSPNLAAHPFPRLPHLHPVERDRGRPVPRHSIEHSGRELRDILRKRNLWCLHARVMCPRPLGVRGNLPASNLCGAEHGHRSPDTDTR